ncbi:MAG: hypothetical protein OEY75_10060 [Hylemonella sp.]|nr:hypothetical protein [Hylemonella sp.]MDH5709445.1 hypothetical protein [Hylemonella sp.]
MHKHRRTPLLILALAAISLVVSAAESGHDMHHAHGAAPMPPAAQAGDAAADARQFVAYPPAMRAHTLASMRDHLKTLGEIQQAMARGAYDQAAELAEQRLGMSSLGLHGAHESAPLMPRGMQQAGTAMHRAASQFALVASNASVTGDLQPALASLARLTQTCVACHAGYRLH